MTPKRRAAILAALEAGHLIRRYWEGSPGHGYLRHDLEGVKCLREAEVEILDREGLLEHAKSGEKGYSFPFAALRLSGDPSLILEDRERRKLANQIDQVKWKDLPTDALRAISTLLWATTGTEQPPHDKYRPQ